MPMGMSSRGFGLVMALVPLAFAGGAALAQAAEGRLAYEIVVTDAGSRSQGWHGILFGADGGALAATPGVTVETGFGVFEAHACTHAWTPCGFIRAGSQPRSAPLLDDPVAWGFRLFVTAEGSRSEGWRGELRHGDTLVAATAGAPAVDTQMGRFVSMGESATLWGWSGWVPEDWLAAEVEPK